MKKKFFTLIYGDRLHVAPKKKIIPADQLGTLQNASEVLEHIKKDAEKYRIQVTQECEAIKEDGFKKGYDDGFQKWTEHLADFEKRLEAIHKELQQSVIPVALKAAKKMIGRELELSEDTIVDIVASNLKAVAQHKKIIIYVNKKDLDAMEKNKPRLRELFENLESLSVRSREDVAPGGCIIETEIGIINAQFEHRWDKLEKIFGEISKMTPKKNKES